MELLILELVLGLIVFAVFYGAALVMTARARRKRAEQVPTAKAAAPMGSRTQFGLRKTADK
jgi:hypothetical protein